MESRREQKREMRRHGYNPVPTFWQDGYLCVKLEAEGKESVVVPVHMLIATIHVPNPNNWPWAAHKNGDRKNNRADNLEWVLAVPAEMAELCKAISQLVTGSSAVTVARVEG